MPHVILPHSLKLSVTYKDKWTKWGEENKRKLASQQRAHGLSEHSEGPWSLSSLVPSLPHPGTRTKRGSTARLVPSTSNSNGRTNRAPSRPIVTPVSPTLASLSASCCRPQATPSTQAL